MAAVELEATVAALRNGGAEAQGRTAVEALVAVGRLWERRLAEGWTPPDGSAYPWAMVRVSLAALVPGLLNAGDWRERAVSSVSPAGEKGEDGAATALVVAHVLAGNTPLLAWPGLAACVLAGASSIVKMSQGETLWPRLFVESLAQVAPEIAARIHLDVWPGEDARTAELVGAAANTVIAYGSDATLATLRAATPETTPFFDFGHALSVGVFLNDGLMEEQYRGFARDILLYDQGGCLSPQTIFAEGDGHSSILIGNELARALAEEAARLEIPPVSDFAAASAVRKARDLAHFGDGRVTGDTGLRWTVIAHTFECDMPEPVGHGVIHIVPLQHLARDFGRRLGGARGHISSVGVAGAVTKEIRAAILAEGVSRLCAAGEMQAPPLDWPNGGRDLLAELLRVGRKHGAA